MTFSSLKAGKHRDGFMLLALVLFLGFLALADWWLDTDANQRHEAQAKAHACVLAKDQVTVLCGDGTHGPQPRGIF